MGFFKVNDDGLLEIDRDEVRGITIYKTILERDRGTKGDNDGRKKAFAFKEFMYIYFISDFSSWIVKGGFNNKEAHKLAVRDSGLPEDYKPDTIVKEGITLYCETQEGELPSLGALRTSITGLKLADKIAKNVIDGIETTLEGHKEKKIKAAESGEPLAPGDDLVVNAGLIAQLNQLTSISNSLPKSITTLEQLQERLIKEKAGSNLSRGGKELGNRADPK